MFTGIDVASERHPLARLDGAGTPTGQPMLITGDRAGYTKLVELLGPPRALIVMEATSHCWKNLFAVLATAEHAVALVNPLQTHQFQEAGPDRTNTAAIDAHRLARLGFGKRLPPNGPQEPGRRGRSRAGPPTLREAAIHLRIGAG